MVAATEHAAAARQLWAGYNSDSASCRRPPETFLLIQGSARGEKSKISAHLPCIVTIRYMELRTCVSFYLLTTAAAEEFRPSSATVQRNE